MDQQTNRFTITRSLRIPFLRSRLFAALLSLGFANSATVALAQSVGTFAPTGGMITARYGHTATLLPNGQVLLAGGSAQSGAAITSAELYDPLTHAFVRTGEMTTARTGHSATLLPDGKVLIVGGASRPNPAFSAEFYDPSTGIFTGAGNMISGGSCIGVLLADGRVLIAHDLTATRPATAELYNPVDGAFSETGDQLLIWSGNQQAALLADGRVLLAHCCTAEQLYDPATGTFSFTGAMAGIYPDGFALAPLTNGTVLVAGGYSEEGNVATAAAALYSPSIGSFNPTGRMVRRRDNHTATLLGDGTVLIAGGQDPSSATNVYDPGFVSSAEVYDPASGTFSATGDLTASRASHTATLLLDGTVLLAGGQWSAGTGEIYRPAVPVNAPFLFSLSGDGRGQGAIWHSSTGQIAFGGSPAAAGDVLSMYTTNLAPGGVIPPQVSIGGSLGEILYFGDAPGYPGYYQVNFRVSGGVSPGAAVSVRLTFIGRPSNEVTIAVQ